MITLNNITLQRGRKILWQDISLAFFDQQKVGIVGKNGCGKTSLFSMLLSNLDPSAGSISLSSQLSIVTIEQEIPDTHKSALEYVIDADLRLRKYEAALQTAEQKQEGYKIAELYAALQDIDGFTATTRAAKILHGLGFSDEALAKPVTELSGGWRMRLNIARALFVPSDVLLLDEPTNHLDLDAVIWLEKWLQRYAGLLLLISHDREFLDRTVTHIAHIESEKIKLYTGNYSQFEKQRIATLALQQKQYEKQQQQIEHIESYIKRFRAKANKSRQAQSRIKALERMQQIMPAHVDSSFNFEFKQPKNLSNPLVALEQVAFSYSDNLVLECVNFQLNAQERIGLLGRNGAGKSTFIKLLAGKIEPTSGMLSKNSKLKIGYFTQHSLDSLDMEKSAVAHLLDIAEHSKESALRKFLGGFDFSGDMALMPVENFSGGEKARLVLALIVWQAPDVLLLDEPTNHLDIDMRQALVLALQNYDGAVIMVSHDRFLLNQVVDDYFLVANKDVQKFVGGLDAYQKWLTNESIITTSKPTSAVALLNKQLKILEKKLAGLEKEITKLDHKLVLLSSNANQNLDEITELQTKRSQAIARRQVYEDEWLHLEGC